MRIVKLRKLDKINQNSKACRNTEQPRNGANNKRNIIGNLSALAPFSKPGDK